MQSRVKIILGFGLVIGLIVFESVLVRAAGLTTLAVIYVTLSFGFVTLIATGGYFPQRFEEIDSVHVKLAAMFLVIAVGFFALTDYQNSARATYVGLVSLNIGSMFGATAAGVYLRRAILTVKRR